MQNWLGGTYSSFKAITPSSTTPVTCRAIYVGGAGNVVVASAVGGALVTFTAPPVGTVLNIELNQGIVDASTTATNLINLA